MASQAAAANARRTPIQLGGAADRRFERRLVAVRRTARYLLLVAVLGWVFVLTFNSFSRPSARIPDSVANVLGYSLPIPDSVTNVLGYSLPILVLLSLVRVVTGSVSREVTVAADPEQVFGLLVDPHAWVRLAGTWLGRYRRIEALETAPLGGTNGRASLTALGLPGAMRWEMLEYRPPHRVVIFARARWIGIPRLTLASWSLQPTDRGVSVRLEQEYRSLGLGWESALDSRMIGWATDRMLARLKAEAEGSPSA